MLDAVIKRIVRLGTERLQYLDASEVSKIARFLGYDAGNHCGFIAPHTGFSISTRIYFASSTEDINDVKLEESFVEHRGMPYGSHELMARATYGACAEDFAIVNTALAKETAVRQGGSCQNILDVTSYGMYRNSEAFPVAVMNQDPVVDLLFDYLAQNPLAMICPYVIDYLSDSSKEIV